MLEILYDTTNNRVRGWCADSNQFGNFTPKPNQAVVVWNVPIPSRSDWYEVDLANEVIITNPDYKPRAPRSTHVSTIEAIDPAKARPVRVKRTWGGKDYYYDCLAAESVKDQYVAGNVAVGDYVIVFFSDVGEQIVTAKIFQSW